VPQPDFGARVRAAWALGWPIARLIAGLGFAYTVERRAPQPSGPLIVAANHQSHLDPPVVGLAVIRPVRFLALDELWGLSPALDTAFRTYRAIPLSRASYPLTALRTSLEHLAAGGRLGVFPEGRRVAAWGEVTPKRGAAWLALRAGVPILPVAVAGTDVAMPPDEHLKIHRARIRVVVGRALDPARHRAASDPIGSLTEAWRRQVDEELEYLAGGSNHG